MSDIGGHRPSVETLVGVTFAKSIVLSAIKAAITFASHTVSLSLPGHGEHSFGLHYDPETGNFYFFVLDRESARLVLVTEEGIVLRQKNVDDQVLAFRLGNQPMQLAGARFELRD